MRKLNALIIGVMAIIAILAIAVKRIEHTSGMAGADVLNIYNWGDYIDPELLKKFEKETGMKVNYETFDSNEAMEAKIKNGGTSYDIAIPSEYMIQKMKSEHLLKKLDHSKITGLTNIDSRFLNLDFDKNNAYSIPYFWGTLGIVYNDELIDGSQIKHWDDLWNRNLADNLMMIDGAREVMGLALNSLGYSLNSTNQAELNEAAAKLAKLTPNIKAVVADEIKMYMINGESAAAVTFSGEAADMMLENQHLHYVIPEEGTNLWFDNIVIPKTSKNTAGAYKFINFMLEPTNAAQNAEYIGYSTPNKKALALLPKAVTSDPQFYPPKAALAHMEVYKNLGSKYLGIYNDLFLEFKMYRK
jgi:spermidine/putrescine transport system substrate-binding protein